MSMSRITEGPDFIDILVGGRVPEKAFILYADHCEDLQQSQEVIDYEATLADIVSQGCQGYTVSDRDGDMSRAENTALRVDIEVHDREPQCLIKQVKCIFDGLNGSAYKDDRSIVRLRAEYISDSVEYAQIHITPAVAGDMPLLTENAFTIDCKIYTMKNVGRHLDGTPLCGEAMKKDAQMITAIRQEADAKDTSLICGEFELKAIFGTKEVNKSLPLTERIAMADYQRHCTYMPDIDNLVFALLASLNGYALDAINCRTIDVAKTYYSEELSPARNIIELKEIRS